MPGILDENVVILKFDNSDFEKNTQQSMQTLDRLKSSFKDSSSAQEFDKIGKAANKVDLSGLADNVDKVARKFSLFGQIGTAAINTLTANAIGSAKRILTAVPNQIIQGGWKRALNIEQAKFQIEGLGLVWDETSKGFKKGAETIKANVLDAVNGTAYGLDEAAKVAAQFAASGMKAGDDMTSSLRAISGVAAMTSSSFEDIGRIFTTVAGNGRLMGDQLLQLSARGMNAAATLADSMGKSEQEVREMVTKGQIDFKTFYKAMDEAFGEHAKKANDTYTGSLANMRAALSRIGADVEATKLTNLRNIFNALTPVIDQVHVLLGGVIERINSMSTAVSNFAVKGLNSVEFALKPYVDAIKGETTQLSYLDRVREHAYQKLSKKQKKATKDMVATQKEAKLAWDIINGKFSEDKKERKSQIEELGESYAKVQRYTNALIKAGLDEEACHIKVKGAAEKSTKAHTKMGEASKKAAENVKHITPMVAVVAGLANVVRAAKAGFDGVKNVAIAVGKSLKTILTPVVGKAAEGFFKFTKKIADAAQNFKNFGKALNENKVKKAFDKLPPAMQKGTETFQKKLQNFTADSQAKISQLISFVDKVKGKLSQSKKIEQFADSMSNLGKHLKSIATDKFGTFTKHFGHLTDRFKEVASLDNVVSFFENLASRITKFVDGITTGTKPLERFLSMFTGLEGKLTGMSMLQFNFGKGSKMVTSLKNSGLGALIKIADILQKANIPVLFNKAGESLLKFGGAVASANKKIDYKAAGKGILGFLKDLDYNELSTIALKIGGLVSMIKVVKNLGDVSNAVVGTLGSVAGFFRSLSGIANQVKMNLKVEVFRTMAMSIAMIAGSIAILAMIPKDRLAPAMIGITTIMGLMTAVIGIVNSSKFDATKMRAVGVAFAGMGAAMLSLSVAAEKLGKMKTSELAKAGTAITAFIGIFVLTGNYAKSAAGAGKSFALMSAAINGLIFAMNALAAMRVETIAKGGAAIMYLMTELAIASRIAGKGGGVGLIAMAMAIDILLPAVVAFALIPTAMIVKGGLAVVSLVRALALAARFSVGSAKGLLAMSTVIGVVAASLTILSLLDTASLAVAATALIGTISAIAIASDIAKQAMKGALAMAGVVTILTTALIVLIKMDVGKALGAAASLSMLGLALGGALMIFSKINPAGVLSGLAGLSIAVAGIIALMDILGGLNHLLNGAIVKGIKQFGEIMGAIGEAFGKFTGGFISGMSSGLPDAATNLSNFMTQIQPFLTMAGEIKAGNLKGVKNLSEVLMNLSLIDFAKIGDAKNLEVFGQSLQSMAAEFITFSKALSTVPDGDVKKVNSITSIMKAFTEIANSIPAEGGFVQKLTGIKSLSSFAEQIGKACNDIVGVLAELSGVTIDESATEKINNIGKIIKAMSKIADDIPESGGALQAILGNTTLSEFASYLAEFAPKFNEFMVQTSGMEEIGGDQINRVDSICKVITKMINVGSQIPPSEGLKQFITGNTTLNEFASQLTSFIPNFVRFMTAVSAIPDDAMAATAKIPMIAKAIAWMSWAAEKIPKTGGLKTALTGTAKLGQFAVQLKDFMPNFKSFMDGMKDVEINKADVDKIQNVGKALESMAKLSNSLKSSGGAKGFLFGNKDLGSFASGLDTLADSIKKVSEKFAGIKTESIAKKFEDVKKAANKVKNLGKIPTGANLATLGDNVSKFVKKVDGASSKGLEGASKAVGTAVNNIVKAAKKAVSNGSALSSFGDAGKKAGTNFANGIKSTHGKASSAGKNLGNAAEKGMKSGGNGSHNIGSNIGQGLINGLNSKKSAAYRAGYELGRASVRGQKDGSNTNSPSKDAIKIGKGIGEGLVIGMKSYSRKVYKKGKELGRESVLATKKGMTDLIDDISAPTITPVLDDSAFRKGVGRLNGLYSSSKAMSISPKLKTGMGELVSSINKMNSKGSKPSTVNNITINVDGAENPELFANRFVSALEMEMRMR